MPDGSKGPSEIKNLVRKHGDIIIAVNGRSTFGKTFKEVIPMLKESSTFTYVRFVHQEHESEGGFTTSCGALGQFLYHDMSRTYKEDRRRWLAKRSLALVNAEEDDEESSTSSEDAGGESDDDSDSEGSASGIESEDDAVVQLMQSESNVSDDSDNGSQGSREAPRQDTFAEEKKESEDAKSLEGPKNSMDKKDTEPKPEGTQVSELINRPRLQSVLCQQETTRHLAYSLLGLDIGYSSDEGGDEDVAYYVSVVTELLP